MLFSQSVELLYLVSGVVLPAFYVPQILRFRRDSTGLASYSLSKAVCQLVLRVPALLFAAFVVTSGFMVFVLTLDLLGRAAELGMAIVCMHRQGISRQNILHRLVPAIWSRGEVAAGSDFVPLADAQFAALSDASAPQASATR